MTALQLGNKIRERRHMLDLSQVELGNMIGLDDRYVSRLELGKMNITIATLGTVFKALKLRMEIRPISK